MLFSILIAHYNNASFLDHALKSVLNQTYTNWEIILVDDQSTDHFEEVIRPYTINVKVKIFRNSQNYGCGYTKKKCASLASGEIMGFLDPDDALLPECLDIMIAEHLTKPDHSIIHSTHFICNNLLERKRIADYPRSLEPGIPYLLLNDGRIHHFASFKKSSYDQTKGISEFNKKAVDQDLYYLMEEIGPVFFIDKPLYEYRIHKQSISTSGKEREAALWHYDIIRDACMRRIEAHKNLKLPKDPLQKKYTVHYYKIGIFSSFRKHKWHLLIYNLVYFIISGGKENLFSYLNKLPKEGISLIRRSFYYQHEIKA